MAFAQPSVQERRPAPALAINLSSNNPFRRAASPQTLSPNDSPFGQYNGLAGNMNQQQQRPRPTSTNPFHDDYQAVETVPSTSQRPRSPLRQVAQQNQLPLGDVWESSLGDQKANNARPSTRGSPQKTFPPLADRRAPPPEDEARRRRMQARGPPPTKNHDLFSGPFANPADAGDKESRLVRPRMRRNSESSVLEIKEEDRRRDDRRRERRKDGDGKTKDGKTRDVKTERPRKTDKRLDLIDKLDLTGMYGGAAFHHDGPFDACNPHRNRKGRRHAPMQAFPEGSANNILGGSGPVKKGMDYDKFHGRGAEGFTDYNATLATVPVITTEIRPPRPHRTESFNAVEKVEPIHGEATEGLGTSTFFEGTMAPRKAVERRESEGDQQPAQGLQRKRSLAQKIRGISRQRPDGHGDGRMMSRDGRYDMRPTSPQSPQMVQSAGGRAKMNEMNPFFSNIASPPAPSSAPPKKEASIQIAEAASERTRTGSQSQHPIYRARTASSPSRGNAKPRVSHDSNSSDDYGTGSHSKPTGGGLLNRVKSLKGKGRRPERTAI